MNKDGDLNQRLYSLITRDLRALRDIQFVDGDGDSDYIIDVLALDHQMGRGEIVGYSVAAIVSSPAIPYTEIRRIGVDVSTTDKIVDTIKKSYRLAEDFFMQTGNSNTMDEMALARSIQDVSPKTPVLYMSGYSFDARQETVSLSGNICAFLAKPFTRQALVDAVAQLLESGSAQRESTA